MQQYLDLVIVCQCILSFKPLSPIKLVPCNAFFPTREVGIYKRKIFIEENTPLPKKGKHVFDREKKRKENTLTTKKKVRTQQEEKSKF